ncbi:oxidoreductase [Halobacteriales archaeon QS_1_68_17]|nr:MAG: oxidoreductase [Halobacteriales archaeon QS_1_68_17]
MSSARSLYFVEPRTVRLEPREVPDPDPGEVLVETTRSLVSAGTELLVYRGEAPTDLDADAALDALDGDLDFPLRYGYAAVGEVVRTGPDLADDWLGRRVFAFNPHESHFTAPAERVAPLPGEVDPETATFLPNVETAVNLALDATPRVGERAVVLGAGIVGLLTTAVLAAYPLDHLAVVDPVADRRAVAERFGADETLRPADPLPFDDRDPGGADLAFELTGSPDALDDAIDAVGYDGRVVVGSWYGNKRADVDLGGRFHRGRVSLVSSQVSTIDPELRGRWNKDRRLDVAWDRLRATDVGELITHRVPFREADRAYELLDAGPENAIGVVLSY